MLQTDNRTTVAYIIKTGRNEITEAAEDLDKSFGTLSELTLSPNNSIHTGNIQQPCRQPLSREGTPRVASQLKSNTKDIPRTRNSCNRFVCNKEICSSISICQRRCKGCEQPLQRRLQQTVGIQTRVGFSTSFANSPSYTPSETITKHLPNSSSALAEIFLGNRRGKESTHSTTTNTGPESNVIDLRTNLPPPQVEKLNLLVWKVRAEPNTC